MHTAADGKLRFPTGGGEIQKAKVKKAKAAIAPDAISAAPGATATSEADDNPPAAATAPEAISAAPEATVAPEGDGGAPIGEHGVDELRARAAALAPDDIEGAKAIIEAAVISPHMDELEKEHLLGAIEERRSARGISRIASPHRRLEAAPRRSCAPRPKVDDWRLADAAARAADKEAERARLAPLVDKLANRRDLIEGAPPTPSQALGVVGERKALRCQLHRHVVAHAR